MTDRQLTLDFEATSTRETASEFVHTDANVDQKVLSKHDFVHRTRNLWSAIEDWILDCTPATEFMAHRFGVFDKVSPECVGTFSDIELVRTLNREWELATGVAIAAEEAALMMAENGHSDDADTLVRAYYLAVALNTLGYDLEHYLPGMPVHALRR